MKTFTRLAVSVLAAVAVAAPMSTATAAPAAKRWTTVETSLDARQQACKVLINDGTAWRISNRLDARRATAPRVKATLTALRDGARVESRSWQSGWVQDGQLSGVGSFKVPRASGWTLEMTLQGDQAGTGGLITVADLRRC